MKGIVIVIIAVVAAIVSTGIFYGCGEEKREKVVSAIRDIVHPEQEEARTPEIVAKQQKKEDIRQNRTWTPENQAKYPVEYCQAQLEKLDEYATTLEAGIHRVNVAISDCRRKIDGCGNRLKILNEFLDMAKEKYHKAEENNAFPVDFNGYKLSKFQAQEKIVQANRQIPDLQNQIMNNKNLVGTLEKKKAAILAEQSRLVALRDRVQNTINDLRTKKVIEGNQNIVDVLNSLSDSIESLGTNTNVPALDDIIAPTAESATQSEFDAIMGKGK